jgi:hypothetical protein
MWIEFGYCIRKGDVLVNVYVPILYFCYTVRNKRNSQALTVHVCFNKNYTFTYVRHVLKYIIGFHSDCLQWDKVQKFLTVRTHCWSV